MNVNRDAYLIGSISGSLIGLTRTPRRDTAVGAPKTKQPPWISACAKPETARATLLPPYICNSKTMMTRRTTTVLCALGLLSVSEGFFAAPLALASSTRVCASLGLIALVCSEQSQTPAAAQAAGSRRDCRLFNRVSFNRYFSRQGLTAPENAGRPNTEFLNQVRDIPLSPIDGADFGPMPGTQYSMSMKRGNSHPLH
jgi:hypothetical protein